MKNKKEYKIILWTIAALAVDLLGRVMADRMTLPIWCDSIGTFLIAYMAGPVCGGIVGFTNNIVYGIFTGFAACTCMLGVFIIFAVITGLHSTLGINYKSWHLFMMLSLFVALIAFVLGAFAYFPYRRKGNSLFKKEYINGTSYKALHNLLKPTKSDNSHEESDDDKHE